MIEKQAFIDEYHAQIVIILEEEWIKTEEDSFRSIFNELDKSATVKK